MGIFGTSRTYLDWAAAAPVSASAHLAFERALRAYGNPSSPHQEGVAARAALDAARMSIARLAEVKADGVVFTSGATEANNLVLRGYIARLCEQGIDPRDIHILYLPGAHASVTGTLASLARSGVDTEALTFADGALNLADLSRKLRPQTRLVVLDGACGETGIRYPTRLVRNALDAFSRKTGGERILLHVDASQLPLAAPFDLTRLGADTVALDAQKVGGIRGVGALCLRGHVRLAPVMTGGGQEHGLRPGTEPVALAAGFAEALHETSLGSAAFAKEAARMRDELIGQLIATVPGLVVNQAKDAKEQLPHILNLSLLGRDTDYLVMLLDTAGFAVSTKSACESDSADGSRAVLALTQDPARAASTLRVSWGPATRLRDLRRLAIALASAISFLDENRVDEPRPR